MINDDVTDAHDVLICLLKLVIFMAMLITRGYLLKMVTPTTKTQQRLQNGDIMEIYDDQLNIYRWITYAILLINAGLYTVGI